MRVSERGQDVEAPAEDRALPVVRADDQRHAMREAVAEGDHRMPRQQAPVDDRCEAEHSRGLLGRARLEDERGAHQVGGAARR